MKIDANDPRWTAYALGEVKDEREKAEMEGILRESAEMRHLVEEIRQTAGLLKEELQAEPSVQLTPVQRDRIEAKATAGRRWFGLKPAWVMAGAAAAVMLISSVTFWELNKRMAPDITQMAALREEKLLSAPPADFEKAAVPESRTVSDVPAKGDLKEMAESVARAKSEEQMVDAIVQSAKRQAVPEGSDKDASGTALTEPKLDVEKSADEMFLASKSAPSTAPSPAPADSSKITIVGGAAAKPDGEVASGVAPGTGQGIGSGTGIAVGTDDAKEKGSLVGKLGFTTLSSVSESRQAQYAAATPVRRRLPIPPPRRRWDEPIPIPRPRDQFNTEDYDHISDNPFLNVTENPLSTFSIDVDTASYANVRRFLDNGTLPPKDAVRIEELVNYFDYDYKGPEDNDPFSPNFEITEAPWNPEHRLLRIGLKAREIDARERPASNLVFLIDISGSMSADNKLPLVKDSMHLLVDRLTESDRVAIVVYASNTHLELPSTSGDQKWKLHQAIDHLHAGGSTNGASGIQLAYETAQKNFIKGGVNRIILATDGDFNVGITNRGDLTRLIEEKADSGIYLSALGFGMGNYKDATLEMLADKGRGNYAYIDTTNEAKKVLVEQINATLIPIAKDVKIQVEFNPRHVSAYRLIGYEDRVMPKEDFNDDAKQAGVIGAGHAVTALYEMVPAGTGREKPAVDPLKYQKPPQQSSSADSDELLTVKIRSKDPEKDTSVLSEFTVKESEKKFREASQDFKFAAAVAAFGMVLRDSPHKGSADMERVLEWAKEGEGVDEHGYRHEFIRLIHRAISITF
jgi:Ca-activated chloride channel family protein